MSNESAPEILTHRDNRNIQVRLDYILLYRSEVKAKLVRILETWTNTKYAEWQKSVADSKEQKSEPPEENLWVTMSYDQFSLFVFGTIQRDTIKQQIDELVASGHIQRRVHPVYPYGSPQYLLNKELVQEGLDNLEIPHNLFDLGSLLVSPRKKRTPQEKYPQGRGINQGRDPGKIPPGTGEVSYPSKNISKNTKNTSKNRDTETPPSEDNDEASATPSTPTLENTEYVPEESPIAEPLGTDGYEKKEDASTQQAATKGQSARVEKPAEQPQQPALIVEKKPMTLDAQVDATFQMLDHVRQKATGDPMASYVRSGKAKNQLKDLIKACKGTPNEVNAVNITLAWMAMWNAPRWSDGQSWQDTGKLTIQAFCNNYGEYLDRGRQAAAPKPKKPTNPERGVSGLKRWVPPGGMSMQSVSL